MTKTYEINDWEKVVRSLIKNLKKDGFEAYKAHDGEEAMESDSAAKLAEHVCACDEGYLYVRKGETNIRLFIVLGNTPEEIVSDWTVPATGDAEFEKSWEKFCAIWENRPTPRKTITR
jgi:uncharacterized damage-inducible protein DinB